MDFIKAVIIVFLHLVLFSISTASFCELKPKGAVGLARDGGNKYRLTITTNPTEYIPGHTYNVLLQGRKTLVDETNTFNGFTLRVEQFKESKEDLVSYAAGIFKLLPKDKNTKIDEFCPNTVIHTSLTFVSSIEVQWIAPAAGSGCVRFRAAIKEKHTWYKDSEGLSLELCEMVSYENMKIPKKCRTCNEAKYELKFEGLWTRQNHPRFYPDNSWLVRFSDVIGASHTHDYRFWNFNQSASPGLIEFSEKENSTLLESEIKSNKTRTVIKAKGISYPNIMGQTFATFRVDPEHHLLSIISLIKPSPDWFVGISGLPLCEQEGKWVAHKNLDLYPYDLGLWGDIKYELRMKPTLEPIHKIDHFNESESPFYTDNESSLRPMAKLYLVKSREYDRLCPSFESQELSDISSIGGIHPDETFVKSPVNSEETTHTHYEIPQNENKGHIQDEDCHKTPFQEYNECSFPECDMERVRILYRQFSDHIRDHCRRINATTEKLQPCDRICSRNKEPVSKHVLIKCAVTEWPDSFSVCNADKCIRNRTRYSTNTMKMNDPECLKIQWVQEVKCLPQDCQEVRKSSRRKPLKEKIDVTISASYIYKAEHDATLCADNKTNQTTDIRHFR